MCPGGTVVAATSEPGRVVTNGMSQYSRNERNANAGIVVGIDPEQDFPGGPLAGVALAGARWKSKAFELGGGDYCAPGQLVGDFVRGARVDASSGEVEPSYKPGVKLGDLAARAAGLCDRRDSRGAAGVRPADRGLRRDDAVLTGVETRTSSPVRITRDAESLQSLNVRGLYPAAKARATPAASCRRASMASRWPKRWRGIWHEIRRHQEAAPEEISRGARALPRRRRAPRAGAQKAAARDARLRESEIYVTRDYAHWSSPLPMHVVQSKQMAQISETRSPQGIAAVVPLLAARARRARGSAPSICTRSRIPAISAPSCARWRGSEISAAC